MAEEIWTETSKASGSWTETSKASGSWANVSFQDTIWTSESERGWFATPWFAGWFWEDRSI